MTKLRWRRNPFAAGKHEIYAKRTAERIECMKVVCHSQFYQGKTLEAAQTMREPIQMIAGQWGPQYSRVLEFKNVLEGWLRGWGYEEDATALRGEKEEQLDGVVDLNEYSRFSAILGL